MVAGLGHPSSDAEPKPSSALTSSTSSASKTEVVQRPEPLRYRCSSGRMITSSVSVSRRVAGNAVGFPRPARRFEHGLAISRRRPGREASSHPVRWPTTSQRPLAIRQRGAARSKSLSVEGDGLKGAGVQSNNVSTASKSLKTGQVQADEEIDDKYRTAGRSGGGRSTACGRSSNTRGSTCTARASSLHAVVGRGL